MKRLIILSGLMLACSGLMFAQTTTSKTKNAKTTSVVKTTKSPKTSTVTKTEKSAKTKTATTSSTASTKTSTHLKSDGTPDKRFKENKEAKGPMKKNGTPDMRYKANKDKAKAKTKQ
ncbi:MAG TPA: hypothetical protein VHD35_12270 [Chitinophagaceae bacterium]|nr:hypothetical protein [Chitinophagaceae bacterium]HVZ98634.1 hypothetical protein [Chitinophagaceae bacterium]